MNVFCTVITSNYFPYALTLFKSLFDQDPGVQLHVLVTDDNGGRKELTGKYPAIHLHDVSELAHYAFVQEVYDRYAHTEMDEFRWAVKPLFISYLLEQHASKVIYVDSDIYFYQDFRFLFDELDHAAVLLTPHWRNTDPLADEQSFYALFTGGIFNAGFIGAGKTALPALKWWASVCHFKMGAHHKLGIHDDQRYLDVLPVAFDNVKIIRHRGCNVGAWNTIECRRVMVNGQVLINGIYPIVFIHFNKQFIREILKGHDALLRAHFETFRTVFEEEGEKLSSFITDLNYFIEPGALIKLKWQLKIRTRLKSFLFKLAGRL
jgi:hypothetical protein